MKTPTAYNTRTEYEKIGEQIQQIRTRQKMTQAELSRAVRTLSPAAISYIENGTRRLQITELKAIAKALGVTVQTLLDQSYQPVTISRNPVSLQNGVTRVPYAIFSDASREVQIAR